MLSSPPRAWVVLPPPLLAKLRASAAGQPAGSAPAPAAAQRHAQQVGQPAPPRRQPGVAARATARRSGAAAAAPPLPPGARSSSGVDPRRLLGFTAVDLTDGLAEIGTVDDVLEVAETGEAQPLLHVCAPLSSSEEEEEEAADGRGRPREEHLVPFVPQIVPSVDLSAGVVYVQPPAGLLDLGRQQQLLAKLERELAPFSLPPPLGLLARMGLRLMPSASQLEKAGRPDLVAAVRQAGGFLEVAQLLGLRSQRKPAGFWDNEANLDEELTLFVAAHWTKFADPESGQSYWYNQITHRISWEEPVMPARVEIDDEGGYILTEAEEDRVMPSRSAVTAAGRYDLHHAIINHGGYTAAAQLLGRPSAWPPSQHLGSLVALRHELRSFLAETGLPRGRMPTAGHLINAGRGDLYQAIVRRGGFAATAQALGWDTQRRARRAWDDAGAAAAELRRFILARQPGSGGARQRRGAGGSSSGSGSSGSGGAAASVELEVAAAADEEVPLPPGTRMPTHRELALAGRHDLKYAIQRHGSAKIAALLGVPLSGRGGHKRARGATVTADAGGAAAAARVPGDGAADAPAADS